MLNIKIFQQRICKSTKCMANEKLESCHYHPYNKIYELNKFLQQFNYYYRHKQPRGIIPVIHASTNIQLSLKIGLAQFGLIDL
jgi:hypothetical protein